MVSTKELENSRDSCAEEIKAGQPEGDCCNGPGEEAMTSPTPAWRSRMERRGNWPLRMCVGLLF